MESFFRREEDRGAAAAEALSARAAPGRGRAADRGGAAQPELIWNGAQITITDEQMKELAETGTLTLSDAQLVWRGKDRQDWSDLVVNVPPLYIQEKIHPQGDHRRPEAPHGREARGARPTRPTCSPTSTASSRTSGPSSTSTTSTGRTA